MEKQAFIEVVRRSRSWIHRMEEAASRIHQAVNQMYDDTLPYGFHLRLTAACVSRYGYEVARTEADVLILYAAAYLHDTIEDARMSYNDVRRFLGAFNDVDFPADVDARRSFEEQVPEIVYALTNEKGRNRAERASEAYYAGIRATGWRISAIPRCSFLPIGCSTCTARNIPLLSVPSTREPSRPFPRRCGARLNVCSTRRRMLSFNARGGNR